jgi:hypothetical protein
VKNSSYFGWWNPVVSPSPEPLSSSYVAFDARAKKVETEAKAKSFVDGSRVTVKGTSGGTYILEKHGDVVSCSCPAWQFTRDPPEQHTCKHLGAFLGEQAEKDRIAKAKLPKVCWCGVNLVRGQCQIHTTDWKGDEKCQCGRAFASCKAAFNTISAAQQRVGHQPRLA